MIILFSQILSKEEEVINIETGNNVFVKLVYVVLLGQNSHKSQEFYLHWFHFLLWLPYLNQYIHKSTNICSMDNYTKLKDQGNQLFK